MSGNGTLYRGQPAPLRYRNHLMSNGRWVGHPGYAGQFLMACPEKRAALALFSVLETPYGDQPGYFDHVIEVFEGILARI